MTGKTIRIYLPDGFPNSVKTVELMNWTGILVESPRNQLDDIQGCFDLEKTGCYILYGGSEERIDKKIIYVGQSDNLWRRVKRHNGEDDDFWHTVIFIKSTDNNLNGAHGRYIESQIINLANSSYQLEVKNSVNPAIVPLADPERAYVDGFLSHLLLLLPILGINLSKSPQERTNNDVENQTPILVLTASGVQASAIENQGGFIVKIDSTLRKKTTNTLRKIYHEIRADLIEKGIVIESDDPNFWKLIQEVPFTSLSSAACVLCGAQVNGRDLWKIADTGKSYADWQNERLK